MCVIWRSPIPPVSLYPGPVYLCDGLLSQDLILNHDKQDLNIMVFFAPDSLRKNQTQKYVNTNLVRNEERNGRTYFNIHINYTF